MATLNVLMYTKGMASGHLSRVNAIYKGFLREGIKCCFSLIAPRSKYLEYLHSDIELRAVDDPPRNTDIFICDWKADEFVYSLNCRYSRAWIGLRRLGKIKSTFPDYFHVIAIEPGVKGDTCIWPIISTWRDEMASREEFLQIVGAEPGDRIALLCENGAYSVHPERILLRNSLDSGMRAIRCSNSPYAQPYRDLDYFPIARLFYAADHVMIGAGYNSVHEGLCFVHTDRLTVLYVGGDDQRQRLRNLGSWRVKCPGDSQAHLLVRYIVEKILE
ncbi:MAG: hypothetical protein AABO57_07735 [Acidobacteriota bacterium]